MGVIRELLESQAINESLVRQRKASATKAPVTYEPKKTPAQEPQAPPSVKDSLHFLAHGDYKHPDFDKHFSVFKRAADRVMPSHKRYIETRGGDPDELESRLLHPKSIQRTAAAALGNKKDPDAGLINSLHQSAKWTASNLLVAKGSGPEGLSDRGRLFYTKQIAQASDRDEPDPRSTVTASALGRGPRTQSPGGRVHHSVPAANKAERFADDPKIHALTTKLMDLSGPHPEKHKKSLHALLNHIISAGPSEKPEEVGATGFHKKAEQLGMKLPTMATWRPTVSRFFKRLRDKGGVDFLRSSIGVHAESILRALEATVLYESIQSFHQAQHRLDAAYANLSEDQLDEIFSTIAKAGSAARGFFGNIGSGWSAMKAGGAAGWKERGRLQKAAAETARKQVQARFDPDRSAHRIELAKIAARRGVFRGREQEKISAVQQKIAAKAAAKAATRAARKVTPAPAAAAPATPKPATAPDVGAVKAPLETIRSGGGTLLPPGPHPGAKPTEPAKPAPATHTPAAEKPPAPAMTHADITGDPGAPGPAGGGGSARAVPRVSASAGTGAAPVKTSLPPPATAAAPGTTPEPEPARRSRKPEDPRSRAGAFGGQVPTGDSIDLDYNRALIEGLTRWRRSARNGVR